MLERTTDCVEVSLLSQTSLREDESGLAKPVEGLFPYDKETPSPYLDNPSLLRREEPATLRSTTLNPSSDSRDVLLVYTHGKLITRVYRDEDGPEAISDDGGGQITSKGLPRAEGGLVSAIRSANPSLQTWLTTFRRDAFHTLPLRLDCEG